jgi:hypothetical protein
MGAFAVLNTGRRRASSTVHGTIQFVEANEKDPAYERRLVLTENPSV